MDGLGEAMKGARTAKGLTVDETAAKLGVNRRQIFRWERDVNEPGARQLGAAADLYGVTLDDLFRRAREFVAAAARAAKKKGRSKAA